ncbi:hypothetical protein ACA910_017865 [Epithemia clementina (nom. ined.)]
MTFNTAIIGGLYAFGLVLMTNAGRKFPLAREPWWHLIMTTGGLWVGHKYPQWENQLIEDLNEVRRVKGLPPLVPSRKWLGVEVAKDSYEGSMASRM